MRWSTPILLVFACSEPTPPPRSPRQMSAKEPAFRSPFDKISLHAGMQREQAENEIATALGKRSEYSPYGNNLRGGTVEYTDGTFVLEVIYKPGASAPWVVGSNGVAEHHPPVDEAVISFRTYRK